MRVKMELLSDAIPGNGESVPGGEDISVLHDKNGFPYYKGTTFKGIFREELERYVEWTQDDIDVSTLMGASGDDDSSKRIVFSDFVLSDGVKRAVIEEIGEDKPDLVLDCMTNLRTFTSINEKGIAREGSLRIARCVNRGIILYSEIICPVGLDEGKVIEILGLIKWIGTMRNRGFGKVRITKVED